MNLQAMMIRGAAAVAVATTMSAVAAVVPAGSAMADDCPDVEVVFARGTGEAPGVGRVGQAFIDALIPQLGGRTVRTFAVNYPASINFFTTAVGAGDAAGQIANMVGQCPSSRLVLGGFSQGAAVVAMLAGVPPLGNTIGSIGSSPPLPPDLADKVSAVAVFGNPSARFGAPDSSQAERSTYATPMTRSALQPAAAGQPTTATNSRRPTNKPLDSSPDSSKACRTTLFECLAPPFSGVVGSGRWCGVNVGSRVVQAGFTDTRGVVVRAVLSAGVGALSGPAAVR